MPSLPFLFKKGHIVLHHRIERHKEKRDKAQKLLQMTDEDNHKQLMTIQLCGPLIDILLRNIP